MMEIGYFDEQGVFHHKTLWEMANIEGMGFDAELELVVNRKKPRKVARRSSSAKLKLVKG